MSIDAMALSPGTATAVRAAVVIIAAYFAVRLADSVIKRFFPVVSTTSGLGGADSRRKTLTSLARSTVRYAVGIILLVAVLDLAGINTSAILGGAAVVGVAVGLGAQNLVRDIISGFFIIYERQYDVGDYISAATVSGVVEEIGLRVTRLRDWSGEVHVIPNGLIERTTNSSRADSRLLVTLTIPHDVDVRKAIAVMRSICDQVRAEYPAITEGPTVLGITDLVLAGVVLTVWGKTKPLQHWPVERELRLRLKEGLESEGIRLAEICLPNEVVRGGR